MNHEIICDRCKGKTLPRHVKCFSFDEIPEGARERCMQYERQHQEYIDRNGECWVYNRMTGELWNTRKPTIDVVGQK